MCFKYQTYFYVSRANRKQVSLFLRSGFIFPYFIIFLKSSSLCISSSGRFLYCSRPYCCFFLIFIRKILIPFTSIFEGFLHIFDKIQGLFIKYLRTDCVILDLLSRNIHVHMHLAYTPSPPSLYECIVFFKEDMTETSFTIYINQKTTSKVTK